MTRVPEATVLRAELDLPDEDFSAACVYLTDEGLIHVDWTSHRTRPPSHSHTSASA